MKRRFAYVPFILAMLALCGCSGKTAQIKVSEEFAKSGLFSALTSAFTAETGYSAKAVTRTEDKLQQDIEKGSYDAALVKYYGGVDSALSSGAVGGEAFYNTLYIIGPESDPSGVGQLGKYEASELLKHIYLTGSKFVHAPDDSALGTRELALWAASGTAPEGEGYIAAADEAKGILDLASQNSAYAIIDRQSWALYGSEYTDLKALQTELSDISDRYYVLTSKVAEGKKETPSQAFARWLLEPSAQALIASYGAEQGGGEPAFIPAVSSPEPEGGASETPAQ